MQGTKARKVNDGYMQGTKARKVNDGYMQGTKARKVNCGRVYSAYILKPVLSGRNL